MGQRNLESPLPPDADTKGHKSKHLQDTEVLKLGVYEVTIEKRPSFLDSFTPARAREAKEQWIRTFSIVGSVLSEVITLEPFLFMALVGLKIWEYMQGLMVLIAETRILNAVRFQNLNPLRCTKRCK